METINQFTYCSGQVGNPDNYTLLNPNPIDPTHPFVLAIGWDNISKLLFPVKETLTIGDILDDDFTKLDEQASQSGANFAKVHGVEGSECYGPPIKMISEPNYRPLPVINGKLIDDRLKTIMIEPTMKKLHFVTSVLKAIEHFHALKINFSAHCVAMNIRESLLDGDLELLDVVESEIFEGKTLPVVPYLKVKAIVKELFAENLIPDYQPKYNGLYIEYIFPKFQDATVVPLSLVAAVDDSSSKLKEPNEEMWKKAENYIVAKQSATAKKLQSRLKNYKVTCAELVKEMVKRGFYVEYKANVSEDLISDYQT